MYLKIRIKIVAKFSSSLSKDQQNSEIKSVSNFMRHKPTLTKVLSWVLPVVSLHLLTSSRKLSYPPVFPTLPSHPRERIGPENRSEKNQNLEGFGCVSDVLVYHYGKMYTQWEIWDIVSNKICKLPNLKVLSIPTGPPRVVRRAFTDS